MVENKVIFGRENTQNLSIWPKKINQNELICEMVSLGNLF
jgi:hypothetical protein